LLWVRRSTAESALRVQHPQLERADGECAELALRAHKAYTAVRGPLLATAFARAAEEVRIGPALLRARGMSGELHFGCIEQSGAAAGLLRLSWHALRLNEYSKGTASHGYRARLL
jgi:hypothetical protein